jgi:hypothetical protein
MPHFWNIQQQLVNDVWHCTLGTLCSIWSHISIHKVLAACIGRYARDIPFTTSHTVTTYLILSAATQYGWTFSLSKAVKVFNTAKSFHITLRLPFTQIQKLLTLHWYLFLNASSLSTTAFLPLNAVHTLTMYHTDQLPYQFRNWDDQIILMLGWHSFSECYTESGTLSLPILVANTSFRSLCKQSPLCLLKMQDLWSFALCWDWFSGGVETVSLSVSLYWLPIYPKQIIMYQIQYLLIISRISECDHELTIVKCKARDWYWCV